MRVLIANLTGGGLSGGYRMYLRELLPRLIAQPEINDLEVVMPPGVTLPPELDGIECTSWSDRRSASAWIMERAHARASNIVFVPTARVPAIQLPVVTMVRNMEPLIRPFAGNSIRDGLRNIGRWVAAKGATRRATRIIAVSEFVRDFLVDSWHVDAARIGVVPHGVSPAKDARRPTQLPEALADGFLFTAGSIRPARGLEDVIRAMALLGDPGPPLVIAGKIDKGAEAYADGLRRYIVDSGIAHRIIWVGHLDYPQMRWCYERALAFVMTSRVEACPNIALEAMSHGAVAVATRCRPMPEFFGPGAFYYQADAAEELASQLRHALTLSPPDRAARRARALERSAQFTWGLTARRTARELTIGLAHFRRSPLDQDLHR